MATEEALTATEEALTATEGSAGDTHTGDMGVTE